jgi:predicted  nucleic acid-binding Zn-ribbon protein
MGSQPSRGVAGAQYESESVIQFAPTPAKGAASNKADELDSAGRSILGLLHKAAGVAEANSQHALDLAQKLSAELRAAEDRIAQLETDVRYYQERTDRAEQWLHKIFTEIEERFFRQQQQQQQDPRARANYQRNGR